MANFGSIDITIQLLGGEQVVQKIQQIAQTVQQLDGKKVSIQVDAQQAQAATTQLQQLNTAQQQVAQTAQLAQTAQQRSAAAAQAAQQQVAQSAQTLATQTQLAANAAFAANQRQQQATQAAAQYYQGALAQIAAQHRQTFTTISNGLSVGAQGFTTLGNALGRVSGLYEGALRGLDMFGHSMTSAGQIAATFAYRLGILAVPFALFLGKGMQFGVEFESEMAKVGTQIDDTKAHVDAFIKSASDAILALSQKFPVAANDMAKALYYIVSTTDLLPQQAQAALEPMDKLAVAGKTDVESIAQAFATVFNVFGDQLTQYGDITQQATHVTDVFWEAVKKGKAEVPDVVANFGKLAQFIKDAGGSLEQGAAMWSLLSRVVGSDQAATYIENLGKAFQQWTKENSGAMKMLDYLFPKQGATGFLFENGGTGERRDMFSVLGDLFDKMRTLDPASINKVMQALFPNIRGEQAGLFLQAVQNWQDVVSLSKQMATGSSGLEDASQRMMETFATQTQLLQNNANILGRDLFTSLETKLAGVVTLLTRLLSGIAQNPGLVKAFGEIGASLAVAAPAALAFGTALIGAGGIISGITFLMQPTVLFLFASIWQTLAGVFKDISTGVSAFGGGLSGVLGLLTEFVHSLGLLSDSDAKQIEKILGIDVGPSQTSAVRAVLKDWKDFLVTANQFKDDVTQIVKGFGQFISDVSNGKGPTGFFFQQVTGLLHALDQLLGFNDKGGNMANNIANVLNLAVGTYLATKLGSIFSHLVANVLHVSAGVVNVAGAIDQKAGIGGIVPTGMISLVVAAVAAWFAVQGKVSYDAGLQRRETLGQGPTNAGDTIFSGLNQRADDLTAWLLARSAGILAAIKDWLTNAIAGMQNAIRTAPSPLFDWLYGGLSYIATALRNWVANQLNEVLGILGVYNATGILELAPNEKKYGYPITEHAYDKSIVGGLTSEPAPSSSGLGMGDVQAASALAARQAAILSTPIVPNSSTFGTGTIPDLGGASSKKSAVDTLLQKIQSMVESVLSPTAVTGEDMTRANLLNQQSKLEKELAQPGISPGKRHSLQTDINALQGQMNLLGPYQDKWDEFRRRLDAVVNGTDPSKYGAAFQELLGKVQERFKGLSIKQISDKFKDFSLFKGMSLDEIKQFVNMDALKSAVQDQIDGIIGKFKFMKQVVSQVISGLSQGDLADLAEALGVDPKNKAAVAEALLNQVNGDITGKVSLDTKNADAAAKTVKSNLKDIAQPVTTTVAIDRQSFDDSAAKITKWVNGLPLNINIGITATQGQPGGSTGSVGMADINRMGENNVPGSRKRAAGGYAFADTLYRLAEQGREYVLPTNTVKFIESVLGHPIGAPIEITQLIRGRGTNYSQATSPLDEFSGNFAPRTTSFTKPGTVHVAIQNVWNDSPNSLDSFLNQLRWLTGV